MILNSKLHFFLNSQVFFCIFRQNFTVINYLYNSSLGNSIFLERETILSCWELIFASENKFKPMFLVTNHLNFDFVFPCDTVLLAFFKWLYCYSSGFMCFKNFFEKWRQNFIPKYLQSFFPIERNSAQCPWNEIL